MRLMPRFHGWKVVAAAFLLAVFAWGIGFYGPGVFIAALAQSRGWPIALLSGAVTLHFLLSAALVAQLPDWHRRFGLAAVTRAGILASAAGVVLWGFASAPWMLLPAAALTGAGWALTSGAAINAMVAPWFERRRPAALSMAYNGASVGGILMTPLWAVLIGAVGFGPAAMVVGAALVALCWPLAGRVIARRPEELGQHPDGAAAPAPPPAHPPAPARSRADLLADPVFRGLVAAFAVALFAQMGLVAHLVSLLLPVLGAAGAGLAMSVVTVFALLGRTLTGWVLPSGPRRRWAASVTFALQAVGSAALLAADGSLPLLLLGCALFGIGVGNLLSLPPLIAQAEFPPADLGRVVALTTAIGQALYAFAPAAFGLLREAAGPDAVPALALALQALAAMLVLRRPKQAVPSPVPDTPPHADGNGSYDKRNDRAPP